MNWKSIARRLDQMPRGSRSRLAAQLDIDRSFLARKLRKETYPTVDEAQKIEGFLDGVEETATPFLHDARRVPIYGYAAATGGERIAFNDGQILDWMELPNGMTLRGEFFVVRSLGSSMEPRIWAGEARLVQRNMPPARDQDVVIEFNDGTAVLKTYRTQRDGTIFCRQYNPEEERRYDATSVKAMHAVFPL